MYVATDGTLPARVLLVEDHRVLRDGLQMLIDTQPDLKVVGTASTAHEALQLTARLQLDIAVLDVQLPDRSGIQVARELGQKRPEIRILILTAFHMPQYIRAARRVGVAGFLLKETDGRQVVAALRTIARGGTAFDPSLGVPMGKHTAKAQLPDALSGRELEVLRLMATGARNETIARELDISPRTVEVHVSTILTKLGASSRVEAVMAGVQTGVVSL